jgi:hypothetical protein
VEPYIQVIAALFNSGRLHSGAGAGAPPNMLGSPLLQLLPETVFVQDKNQSLETYIIYYLFAHNVVT